MGVQGAGVDLVDHGLEVGAAAGDEDCCTDWGSHFEGFDEEQRIGGVVFVGLERWWGSCCGEGSDM